MADWGCFEVLIHLGRPLAFYRRFLLTTTPSAGQAMIPENPVSSLASLMLR